MVRKSQIPFNAHFFSVASSPATASPCCVITIPIVFVFVCCLSGKFPELKNLISHVGMGKMQSMFLAMRFCIAEKLRCVEKVLRRIELQKIHNQ